MNYNQHKTSKLATVIFAIASVVVLIQACGDSPPQNSSPTYVYVEKQSETTNGSNPWESSQNIQVIKQTPVELFADLNRTLLSSYCGVWQLYKRHPHGENERMIKESQFLDLKNDYTWTANGWTLSGTGNWTPYFNYSSSGEQWSAIMFYTIYRGTSIVQPIKAEVIVDNGSTMLKLTEMGDGDIEYYIKK